MIKFLVAFIAMFFFVSPGNSKEEVDHPYPFAIYAGGNKENTIPPAQGTFPPLSDAENYFLESKQPVTKRQAVALPYEQIKASETGFPSIWGPPNAVQQPLNTVQQPYNISYHFSHAPSQFYPPMVDRTLFLDISQIQHNQIAFSAVQWILTEHGIHESVIGKPSEGGHGIVYFTQNYAVKITTAKGVDKNEVKILQKISEFFKARPPQGVEFCLPLLSYNVCFEGQQKFQNILIMSNIKAGFDLELCVVKALKQKDLSALGVVTALGYQLGLFQVGSMVYDRNVGASKVLTHQDLKIWNIIASVYENGNYQFTLIDNADLDFSFPCVDVVHFLWHSVGCFYLEDLEKNQSNTTEIHQKIQEFFAFFLKGYFYSTNYCLNTIATFLEPGKPYAVFRSDRVYPLFFEGKLLVIETLNQLMFKAALQNCYQT